VFPEWKKVKIGQSKRKASKAVFLCLGTIIIYAFNMYYTYITSFSNQIVFIHSLFSGI